MGAVLEMFNYARGVWSRNERSRPTTSRRSSPRHRSGEHELDVIDFNLFFLLLIDAGGDTTRNLVAGGMDALFAHPEQLAWLAEDLEGRMGSAVEELLRWISPVVYMRRTATRDTEVDGVVITAGQKVVMYTARPTATPTHSVRPPTSSTCRGRRTTTSRSAGEDRTSASARTSRASRSTPSCGSCSRDSSTSNPPARPSGSRPLHLRPQTPPDPLRLVRLECTDVTEASRRCTSVDGGRSELSHLRTSRGAEADEGEVRELGVSVESRVALVRRVGAPREQHDRLRLNASRNDLDCRTTTPCATPLA